MTDITRTNLHRLIKESNAIESIFGLPEIEQSLIAWDYLYAWNLPLRDEVVCMVQKIITANQTDLQPIMRGFYRSASKINVRVGNHIPPDWSLVRSQILHWIVEYTQMTPWDAHVEFERIHPFVDGNGRTGRMLMWWDEVKRGGEPTLIKADDRYDYYARLSEGRL